MWSIISCGEEESEKMKNLLLTVENVEKSFPAPQGEEQLKVLKDVSFSVSDGEIVAILGPSGCGKTTLLNLVAGFESVESGEIMFRGEPVNGPSSQRGVVFQEPVLFPWLTVKENISFGLRIRKEAKQTIDEKCKSMIELVGLEGFASYYPEQLSGGMQQRVSLARVLIMQPEVLLMDEPFAALDAQTRMRMQQLLLSVSQKLKPAIVFVTHDIEEALIIADRIYLLSPRPGRIIREIRVPFERPRTLALYKEREFTQLKGEILETIGLDT